MVALGALAGMGLAASAWLLVSGLLDAVAARSPMRTHRGLLSGVPRERFAVVAGAGLVVWFVSRWPVAGLAAVVAAWWVPLPGQRAARQQADARTAALAQWCAALHDAAGTARGIEGILTATAPAAPAAIHAEVARMATRLEAHRLDVVLDRLAEDLDHPIGDLIVTALRLAATAGSRRVRQVLGDLATAAELEASMRRRVDVARQRGHRSTPPLTVNHVAYLCNVTVNGDDITDDQQHRHDDLGGGWHVTHEATWYALRRPGNGEATSAARKTFSTRILPTLRRWLDTPDAQALLAEGHRHWRRRFAQESAETEADLVAAFQRLQTITARVNRDEAISADDERFATQARVRLP